MEKPKDFYRVLGVARNASAAAIRRAYRRLAKQYHPESNPGASLEAFRELQLAYETLSDAERRQRYDEALDLGVDEDVFGPLSWSFVRRPASGDLRRPVQPGSLSGEILLTTEEAAVGGILPLDIPLRGSCPACSGTGGSAFDCARCGGEGTVERRMPIPVRIPQGVRDGAVFQVNVDEPGVSSVLLTVHIRRL
ncbi:MAG TPA: DnaJ domain-containing protein [Vicinamibacteria bacterium]|nr:DnaJ domain-containing protein [Vicinamibacteria bacterium]